MGRDSRKDASDAAQPLGAGDLAGDMVPISAPYRDCVRKLFGHPSRGIAIRETARHEVISKNALLVWDSEDLKRIAYVLKEMAKQPLSYLQIDGTCASNNRK